MIRLAERESERGTRMVVKSFRTNVYKMVSLLLLSAANEPKLLILNQCLTKSAYALNTMKEHSSH